VSSRYRHSKARSLIIVALAVVVVAGSVVAFSLAASAGSGPNVAPVGQPAVLSAHLAALQRPANAADALPPILGNELDSVSSGVEIENAREAYVTVSGDRVYLVPSATGVCLADSDLRESGCFTAAEVVSTGATMSDECSPYLPDGQTIEIAGVLPDSAKSAAVVLSDGTRLPLTVEGNTYIRQFARNGPLPELISWESASGPVTVSAHVPADAKSESCATRSEVKKLEAEGKIPPALGHPPANPTGSTVYNNG
jgi:hypothetical protein